MATLAYERYRDSDNLVARLALPCMCYAPERPVNAGAQALGGAARFEIDPEKLLKYLYVIIGYADIDDAGRTRYQREYRDETEITGSFSERFIRQVLEQGMKQSERLGVGKGGSER